MPFEIDVQLDLGGTLVLKRSQVGIKIDQKSVLGDQKSVLGCPCGVFGEVLVAQTEHRGGGPVFWRSLGFILAGSWAHLGVEKSIQKSIKKLLHVGFDF